MFQLEDVRYKDILAIENLTIETGQITCIVGKSGGGKTTFLKLLNNMYTPDQGTITFEDRDILEYEPTHLRQEVAMLPQNPVVFSKTIGDNFRLALEYSGSESQKEDRFKKMLEKVQLDHNLDTDADNLSGGEKQRLALARVLLLQPDILLLDEPSSALDEETEKFIIEMVVDYIRKRNGTLVMVTHSKSIAKKYGEKMVTINNGQIESVEMEGSR